VGIWQNKHFPIYFDLTAANLPYIIVSGGELSRSDKVTPQEVVNLIHSEFADLLEHD